MALHRGLYRGLGVHRRFDVGLGGHARGKAPIACTGGGEHGGGDQAELLQTGLHALALHLRIGQAAQQMGLHVFGLGRGGIVYIAADVEVVIVLVNDGGFADQRAVLRQLQLVGEHVVDLLNVFGAQFVLVFASANSRSR